MSTLEARIAEVLAPLLSGEGRLQWERKWEDSSPLVKSAWNVLAGEYAAMLAPLIREAKAEALREAVDDLTGVVEGIQSSGSPNSLGWQVGALAMRDRLKIRADKLVTDE